MAKRRPKWTIQRFITKSDWYFLEKEDRRKKRGKRTVAAGPLEELMKIIGGKK